MISSESKIYIEETEVKPNHAAVIVMIATICIMFIILLANEMGIFRVGTSVMRFGAILSIIVLAVPVIIMKLDPEQYKNPKIKYMMLFSTFIFTMDVVTMFTFHSEMMLLLPIFFAMLYRSKELGKIALISSIVATIVAPSLGYYIGVWDVPLFQELIFIATGGGTEIINPTYEFSWLSIGEILLYVSSPRLLVIIPCGLLMFRVISISTDHVNSEILLNRINNVDTLTGLYNQNYYREYLASEKDCDTLGVIFFDVNGLKAANDKYGHEYGDVLLKRCAQSIIALCDDFTTIAFRVGGDEFLMVIEGATEPVVIQKISEWRTSLDLINHQNIIEYNGLICSMATGYAVGPASEMENIVRRADSLMYKNKALIKSKLLEFGDPDENSSDISDENV